MTTLAMRSHMRQEGAHAVDHAHQIYIQNPPPVVERDMVDATPRSDPSIVHRMWPLPKAEKAYTTFYR